MNLKGSLPLLILAILEDGPNHGYRIAKRIKHDSQGVLDFREGTLYPTLHGLEKDGLIAGRKQTTSGCPRKYYSLTDAGRAALQERQDEWQNFMTAVNRVLKRGDV